MPSDRRYAETDNGRSVATQFTLNFLEHRLPPASKVLEIGCGLGHLAAELGRKGYAVVGIDTSEEAVAAARSRGVRAELTQIEGFKESGYDAILFTRSLHHVHSLDSVLGNVRDRLNPGGLVLLEEFSFDSIDAGSATWFQNLKNKYGLSHRRPEWVADPDLAFADWKSQHAGTHHVHSGREMESALGRHFDTQEVIWDVPYFFRYFAGSGGLPSNIVQAIFVQENALLDSRKLRGVGVRMVARRH